MKSVNVDDVLKILYKYGKYIFVTDEKKYSSMVDEIANLKALEQEPKTGHWINVNKGKWNTIPAYKCSACGANADLRDWSGESPFCPWCGAMMVESQENCDTCKNKDEEWDSEPCDGCCGNHSGFEPQESEGTRNEANL